MSNSKRIEPGDKMPDLKVWRVGTGPAAPVCLAEWIGEGTTVMFALPGAYTPTCSNQHLPGFVDHAAEFAAIGVKNIICVSVNDHFVMQAWAESQKALGKVQFIADFDTKLTVALGLAQDLSAGGLGLRSLRAALIIDDGVVRAAFVDDKPGQLTNTSAMSILDALRV